MIATLSAPVRTGQKIAVIGSGITGLSTAWLLSQAHDVHVFEADSRIGGHANTVATPAGDQVDMGFIVFNRLTYPNLCALFSHLGVGCEESDMSFGVSLDDGRIEYSGDGLNGVFGQRRHLIQPSYYRMLSDLLRFYKKAPEDLANGRLTDITLGEYLHCDGYGERFQQQHILPMGAAIWSSSITEMLAFPAENFVSFYVNHDLFRLKDQVIWRTVTGGSRSYVEAISQKLHTENRIHINAPITAITRDGGQHCLDTASGETFSADQVVFACHTDQAIAILGEQATPEQCAVLGRIRYQRNRAVLHQDTRLMPRRRRVWTSWNYLGRKTADGGISASITYWMNRLQNIDRARPYFVSLNPLTEPDPAKVLATQDYTHPVFDTAAIAAQTELPLIQGANGLWFGGAWAGHGFHEDGIASGLAIAESIGGVKRPWQITEMSPAALNTRPVQQPIPVAAE